MSGITMIEVLVSLMILSVGLLGVAGLQLRGIQANQGAYFRSQATFIAYDMIDRMRTNPNAMSVGSYNNVSSSSLPTNPTCITTANGCAGAALANHDINEWAALISRLPSGTGTVTMANNVHTITVNWVEHYNSTNAALNNKSVNMEVQL